MWDVIGSWPLVGLVVALGCAVLLAAWWRSDRRVGRTAIAAGALVIAGLGLSVAMTLPLTVDGTTCNNRATPYGVNHTDLDDYAAEELRDSGAEVDRYECRDALRSRYLLAGAGYLVLTLGGAALVARRPRAAARD